MIKLIVLLGLLAQATALSRSYTRGPISLNDDAKLHYSVNAADKTISFALVVTNDNLNKISGAAWAGIGISEKTSGSMLGADIASVEFSDGEATDCKLTDRHVPFSAYPLNETVGKATGVYPNADFCQNDDSWTLVSCKRDALSKTITMEVTRAFSAHDEQDRAIESGAQQLIYAYGAGSFKYHGTLRGGRQIELFNDDLSLPDEVMVPLPSDVVHNQTIINDYAVPSDKVTTYSCTAFELDLPPGGNVTMVGADPVLGTKSGPLVAHHLLVYVCPKGELFNNLLKNGTSTCGSNGELPNPTFFCTGLIYSWAIGIGRFVTPDNVGFVLGDDVGYVMEVHYDNNARTPGIIDRSGARLYYSSARPIEAGTMWLGDTVLDLRDEKVKSNLEYESNCPSNCTSNFKQPLKIFGSFLHMHTTGKSISTKRYHANGTFAETVSAVDFWSNDHQMLTQFMPPKIVQPGDRLSTTCVYDTRKRPDTIFGSETQNEMCMDFAFYYPKQDLSAVPGVPTTLPSGSLIRCGFVSNMKKTDKLTLCGPVILPIPNLKLNPVVEAPGGFGTKPDQCVLASQVPACFPGHSMVQIEGGLRKRMYEIRLNDYVHVGNGVYSKVFAFTHRDPASRSSFVQIHSGKFKLTLTPGHYIYVNDELITARNVRVGDFVKSANGEKLRVERVTQEKHTGLFNPQTLHGDIVVDGIIASTYTTEVKPVAAHALLTPVRLASRILNAHIDLAHGWKSVL